MQAEVLLVSGLSTQKNKIQPILDGITVPKETDLWFKDAFGYIFDIRYTDSFYGMKHLSLF